VHTQHTHTPGGLHYMKHEFYHSKFSLQESEMLFE